MTYGDIVRTEWDVSHFSGMAKITKANADGSLPESDQNLAKYYKQANFGDLTTPATILDCRGRILAWHLPDIITKSRIVHIIYHSHAIRTLTLNS